LGLIATPDCEPAVNAVMANSAATPPAALFDRLDADKNGFVTVAELICHHTALFKTAFPAMGVCGSSLSPGASLCPGDPECGPVVLNDVAFRAVFMSRVVLTIAASAKCECPRVRDFVTNTLNEKRFRTCI
jgi:hypothetical protein